VSAASAIGRDQYCWQILKKGEKKSLNPCRSDMQQSATLNGRLLQKMTTCSTGNKGKKGRGEGKFSQTIQGEEARKFAEEVEKKRMFEILKTEI